MRGKIPLVLVFFLFAGVALLWAYIFEKEERLLTVSFLDVGQGDAIFIETPNGNQMLIDGGPDRSVLRELGEVMPFWDRTIDVVMMTHPDRDHVGGLPDVVRSYDIDYFFEPGVDNDSGAYDVLLQEVAKDNAGHILARRGTVVWLDHGIYVRILYPDREVGGLETNSASIVAQLVYGETDFLFSGDAPSSVEKYVASLEGESLESEVIKAGHHGSQTSSAMAYVALASPAYAVISAGKDNQYGHPHVEVLNTFAQFEAKVLGTYEGGRVTFVSDGTRVQRK